MVTLASGHMGDTGARPAEGHDTRMPWHQADIVVTSLDLLLEGVEPPGATSERCIGPVFIGTTEKAVAGSATSGHHASQAPPDADGWLLVSRARAEHSSADPNHSTT